MSFIVACLGQQQQQEVGIMAEESKRAKSEEEEDRISALPDSLIHHILSFLPLTKQAIQTGILSKRWHNQWTCVPVLIFDCSGMQFDFSDEKVSTLIDNTLLLHDCSKLNKFHFELNCSHFTCGSRYYPKIRFAIRKQVEEIVLLFYTGEEFRLPNFIFGYASLIRLRVYNCGFMPNGIVNWGCLKELIMVCCTLPSEAIESIVSGSPVLQSLEINSCVGFDQLVIASKSLKKLILENFKAVISEISCPNLEELSTRAGEGLAYLKFSDQAIENILSTSMFLESLEMTDSEGFERLFIASKSLKKLALTDVLSNIIEISCPNLEELKLCGLDSEHVIIKLMNLSPSICVSLDFEYLSDGCDENLAKQILEQIQHVKELKLGSWFIRILSALELGGLYSSLLCNCITLDGGPNRDENLPGIAYALRSSSQLEKLVMKLQLNEDPVPDELLYLENVTGENYWNTSGIFFECLESHLKNVTIIGLSKRDGKLKLVFEFVEFLLKNARMLEKIVVILADYEVEFVFEVSQKLLGFPRCSQHSTVELLCSKEPRKPKDVIYDFDSHL